MNKEAQLAEVLVNYLQNLHWEIYQEVLCRGSVADIVAKQGNRIWIIETKMSLSISLISQVLNWRHLGHWVSAAIPQISHRGRGYNPTIMARLFQDMGLGLMEVGKYDMKVATIVKPRISRRIASNMMDSLQEEQKTYSKAGNDEGQYWTPFKRTCSNIITCVNQNPGIILKEMIKKVDHHYASVSSAKQSIVFWLDKNKISGVKIDRRDGNLRLYPATFELSPIYRKRI